MSGPPQRPHHPRRPRPLGGVLREVLFDPERDHCPGARPVVAWSDDDDFADRRAIEERALGRVRLRRRGVQHGRWAELRPDGIVPKVSGRKRRLVALRMRWHAARPILLPELLDREALGGADRTARLHRRLGVAGGLADWLGENAERLEPEFVPNTTPAEPLALADPERDIERIGVRAPGADDLWLKTGRLSAHPGDRSLRLRVAFGREGPDDASRDEARHELVRALGERLLPTGALLARESPLAARAAEIADLALWPTQPIVYWNAPAGGALFHHDGFDAPAEEQQAAVCYVQLTGRTAWLALSIGDLALRVREFLALTDEEPDDDLAAALDLTAARALAADLGQLTAELARPGCGALGPLVNRGPEMTSFLADSGHAWVLAPGDAILLPNFGLERTAMHSVFCASEDTATGLSVALRRAS